MNVKQSTLALAIVAALPFAAQAAPKVAFSAPLAGSTISGDIYQNSRCEVKGSSDIRRVVFWLDGNVQLNTEGSAPWNCNVNTTKYYDGTHRLKAVAYDRNGASTPAEITLNFSNNNPAPGSGGGTTPPAGYGGTPYSGTPIALPGVFEAENFDKGGNNVAYRDLSNGNSGGQYRTADSVDIAPSLDAAGGGYKVYYFQTGEWLAYTVNVPADGTYDIAIRAANKNMTGAAFRAEIDGVDVTGNVAVPSTGSWSSFQWVGKSGVPLKAGSHVLKLVAANEYFDVNQLRVAADASTPPPAYAYSGTPYSGTPISVPKAFEAEDFDKGGNNVAYKDLSAGNAGGQYRTGDSVDIIASSDPAGGGYAVSYFQTGEWMAYTLNVPADGNYDISVRAANKNMTGAAFRAEIDGVDVTGKVAVPATGSWTDFTWVGKSGVPLKAGKRILKIVSDQEYFNLNAISVLAPGGTPPTGGTPANQPPTVSFKAPTSGAELSGTVNSTTCEVNANDDVKVTRVEFALGGTALAPKTAAPWQCAVDTTKFTDGGYQLKAVAYDDAGQSASTEVAVSVKNGAVSTPPASGSTPPGMLFWSGYEGAIAPGTPFECYKNGCWQELNGTDSVTGFTWPPKVSGSAGKFQLLVNGSSQPTTTSVYNYMRNEIQTVTGPKGSSSRALYSHIAQSGCCGTEPQGSYATQNPYLLFPTSEVKDFYASYWVKFQPDLKEKLHDGDAWRPLFEFKTSDTDYRLTVGVLAYGGAEPYWEVKTDSWAPTRQTFWKVSTQNQLTVPGGKWIKLEVYWRRSGGSDGRIWAAVDGKVIADKRGPNMGPNNSPINRIMLSQLYSGSSYPIYQWVDDVQIWSTFPTVSSGDPWYDPPYAPR